MRAEASPVQPLLRGRRDKILLRQSKISTCTLDSCLRHAAAHPQQPFKIETRGGCRDRIEGVRDIDPGTYLARLRHSCEERERHRGPTRALGTYQLGDGSDRKSAL